MTDQFKTIVASMETKVETLLSDLKNLLLIQQKHSIFPSTAQWNLIFSQFLTTIQSQQELLQKSFTLNDRDLTQGDVLKKLFGDVTPDDESSAAAAAASKEKKDVTTTEPEKKIMETVFEPEKKKDVVTVTTTTATMEKASESKKRKDTTTVMAVTEPEKKIMEQAPKKIKPSPQPPPPPKEKEMEVKETEPKEETKKKRKQVDDDDTERDATKKKPPLFIYSGLPAEGFCVSPEGIKKKHNPSAKLPCWSSAKKVPEEFRVYYSRLLRQSSTTSLMLESVFDNLTATPINTPFLETFMYIEAQAYVDNNNSFCDDDLVFTQKQIQSMPEPIEKAFLYMFTSKTPNRSYGDEWVRAPIFIADQIQQVYLLNPQFKASVNRFREKLKQHIESSDNNFDTSPFGKFQISCYKEATCCKVLSCSGKRSSYVFEMQRLDKNFYPPYIF